MTCPQCRNRNPAEARFCTECGTPLVAPEASAGPDADGGRRDTDVIERRPAPGEDADDDETDPTDPADGPSGSTTVVRSERAELRECPNCDAPNSARRNICGRCGADLSTGEIPGSNGPIVSEVDGPRRGAAARDRERLEDEPSRTGRLVALVVAVGVLLGALIGGLIALDAGPFGQDEGEPEMVEAPPFDPARYEDDAEALTVTAIGTSTTHEPLGDERYDASQMVDRDLTTAWNNAGTRNAGGVGEVIAVEFEGPVWIDEVVLGNGSQASDAAFLGNARLERARFRLDGGVVYEVTFLDRQQLQSVQLPEPVLTTGVLVDVLSVFAGDTYEDLAISELRFRGWPADESDRSVAEERAGR